MCVVGFKSFAQFNLDSLKNNKYYKLISNPEQDTTYIGHYNNTYYIRPFYSNNQYLFTIKDSWSFGNDMVYKTNIASKIGFTFGYKLLSISLSIPLHTYLGAYGKTENFELALNTKLSFMNWSTDFYFARSKGYFFENPKGNFPGWTDGSPIPRRPDLKSLNIGIGTRMVFSKKYSIKAATLLSEKQLKSAGGITLGLKMQFHNFVSDSDLIAPSQLKFYNDIKDLTAANFLTLAFAPGYSYTYVNDDFFVSGTALIGLGMQMQLYKQANVMHPGLKLNAYTYYRISAGYNIEKYYASISYSRSNQQSGIKDSKFIFSNRSWVLSGGMRF